MKIRLALSCLLFLSCLPAAAEPPFSGTIFLDPDIIVPTDRTTYLGISDKGQDRRKMFDRRRNAFLTYNAHLFEVRFRDAPPVEVQVNPEFSRGRARLLAAKYAKVIGRIPLCLRADVDTIWIHDGVEPFGGGNRNLLIHEGQGALYRVDGILEETFVHEASHTSLDARHRASAGWRAAQSSDGEFLSTYARDNPRREDIAETFLMWLAVRFRPERLEQSLINAVKTTVPGRLNYFDRQQFVVRPVN